MIPLHQIVSYLGSPMSKCIVKAHILTGNGCLSKTGTKHAAIASDSVQYLSNFGETTTLTEQDKALAEEYLVKVWTGARSKTHASTFSQLRPQSYCSATAGIGSLPPTSSVMIGHIQRGAFLLYKACHLLAGVCQQSNDPLEPQEYGWENRFSTLLPSKHMKVLPFRFTTICKCTGKC